MKTKTELLELVNTAILTNKLFSKTEWFIEFSGHVNVISIRYYSCGWEESNDKNYQTESVRISLDSEDSIQEGYWFLKNRIK
tara:strand:+ start:1497 stop:1742 length:246 start_codon:yes stop_codon:yes gene_type:complete